MNIKTVKTAIVLFILIMGSTIMYAQPAAPSNPGDSGNAVPVGSLLYLLPAVIAGLGILKLSRKKK